ncbi:MAG: phosphoesterase [Gammaproteobacteria bacterium RIFCSPHIGHO2_12_FULL_35_23]|nr:MAG: phosphoesterase [Gammaproteobacteria bacterium RIFCSPHIGHO2_12_FULL_35_23]
MADAYWRDSARVPRFFSIDARAAFPLLLFLLHIRLWTFIVAVMATLFFAALDRYGFRVDVFLRWLRGVLMGKRKITAPWWI